MEGLSENSAISETDPDEQNHAYDMPRPSSLKLPRLKSMQDWEAGLEPLTEGQETEGGLVSARESEIEDDTSFSDGRAAMGQISSKTREVSSTSVERALVANSRAKDASSCSSSIDTADVDTGSNLRAALGQTSAIPAGAHRSYRPRYRGTST